MWWCVLLVLDEVVVTVVGRIRQVREIEVSTARVRTRVTDLVEQSLVGRDNHHRTVATQIADRRDVRRLVDQVTCLRGSVRGCRCGVRITLRSHFLVSNRVSGHRQVLRHLTTVHVQGIRNAITSDAVRLIELDLRPVEVRNVGVRERLNTFHNTRCFDDQLGLRTNRETLVDQRGDVGTRE